MSPPGADANDLLAGAPRSGTVGSWLRLAEKLYARADLAFGQVATNAHDEALYLLLHTLGLPLDSTAAVLHRKLTPSEMAAVRTVFHRRIVDRVPAAYLTKEAWLGGHRFYVDERVIIPRSYFLEIIPRLKGVAPLVVKSAADLTASGAAPLHLADVCTGSGCLAILLARHFPRAKVDAIDVSPDALEVAEINVRTHRLGRRVTLHRSDVFDAVPLVKYDLILSNPPYEPSARMKALPEEFRQEPRLALDGGKDGLDVIRKLLRQARRRLKPRGRVLIEVGGLRAAMDREFAALRPVWLPTEDGADCVCAIGGESLAASATVAEAARLSSD